MKKETAIRIFCSLLILLFAYAGLSKLTNHAMFEAQLTRFPLIGNSAVFLSWVIPLIELIMVVLLFVPKFERAGLYASAIVLTLFTLFLVFMMGFVTNLPCSCGGVITQLTWKQHVFFNLFFLTLSLAGIYLKRNAEKIFVT